MVISCYGLIDAVSSEINFESEHVLTVCDASTIWHTRRGQPIPECPLHLPSARGFFDNLKGKLYERKCDDNITQLQPNETTRDQQTDWIERSVLIVEQVIGSIRDSLKQIVVLLVDVVEDVTGLKSMAKLWDHRVNSILSGFSFLLFHLTSNRKNQWIFNILLAVFTSFVFYFVHLYYQNWLVNWLLIAIAFFVGSPLYIRTCLPGLGAVTLIHLTIPLLGLVLQLAFEAQLLFGPVLNLVINVGSILIHVICLIGLYIDEKFLIVKVILLPFYRTFIGLFDHNESNSELVEAIRHSIDELTAGLLSSTDFKNKNALQLDEMLTNRLRQLCVNTTVSWYSACPVLFARSCTSYVDQTELSKIDHGFEAVGQWLTGLFVPSVQGTTQRTLSKQLCQKISNSACLAVDVTEYCSPDQTFYGRAYHTFSTAVDKLKDSVLLKPLLRLNSTLFDSFPDIDVNVIFEADWIWISRRIVSFLLVGSAVSLLLRAIIQSAFFIRRYKTDIQLGSRDGMTSSSKPIFKLKLVIKVLIFYFVEKATKWTHETLGRVKFAVPERGDARLAFNVQGDGTIASIVRAVLGGFSVQSKYCTRADSLVCTTPFFPVNWPTWIFLFSLAGLYLLIGLYQNRSDYLICRVCDYFFLHTRQQRNEFNANSSRQEKRRRRQLTLILTEEALLRYQPNKNKIILKFYHPPRRWYHHRLTPTIVQSMIACIKFKIDNLSCQICFQDVMTTRFRCKTLLFCDQCKIYLKRCPCGRPICQQNETIPI